jgi:outer membrane protein
MHTSEFAAGKAVLVGVLLGCCWCCSCAEVDTGRSHDTIGPKTSEPTGLPAQTPEPNRADAVVSAPAAQRVPPGGPLTVTVERAALLALENNPSLMVQRFNPQIERTVEQQQLAAFDPDLTARVAQERDQVMVGPTPYRADGTTASVGVQEFLPTGTSLGVTGNTSQIAFRSDEEAYASRVAFNATQSLLRGFGPSVNLASVNQARLDVEISQYELRGYAQILLAQVEETYWDYVLSLRQVEIFQQSLGLAQRQLEETQERIHVGDLARSELPAAEAEVALRREDLINARSASAKTKLNLLRLINPAGSGTAPNETLWTRDIVAESRPVSPSIALDDVEPHVALALQMRPDLNQARLLWQRDELEIVKTRNGLLPRLDLFVTLGKTGYAGSFGNSVRNIRDDNYDASVGLIFEYPPMNRAAKARNLQAVLTRRQQREAIDNLAQLIEVDVRGAYLEIARAQEQVTATAATRRLQDEKLQSETEKFRLGKSTSLLVAQVQRDLVAAQIAEVQAVVSYLKAFVELYRLEGSLLDRRGINAPGREPVKLPDDR